MENPSQSHYTVEELFMLKPDNIERVIENPVVPAALPVHVPNTIPPAQPIENAFWPKYKWYIIVGGVFIIAGAGWYFYNENKRKKKSEQNI